MRDRLFSLPGIGRGEKYVVSMLLVQALLLGIFIGAFDISAHSLFLAIFDEKMLAKAYVVSGFAGIFLLTLYFFFQARMKFRSHKLMNLIFIAAVTLLLWISLAINHSGTAIFIVFIMLGPLNILAVIGFRATAGILFTAAGGKRLNATIDTALIIGIIISCYFIPVLISLSFPLHDVLFISFISVLVSAVIQVMIGLRSRIAASVREPRAEGFKSSLSLINTYRNDPYFRILGIFIILSVISAFFIQYSFLAVTREKFPSGEEMAIFLGIFTGSIMILTLFGKLLLFSYLLRNYGLKVCLTISPVLLAIFTAIAIALGMLMGYTMETAGGFMIFFILLTLIRLLSKTMDDSIESPSFRLLYQTIDEKLRFGVQSFMDSAVKEAGAFLAGLILAGFGVLTFIKLIHFSWILVAVLIVWLISALRLYAEYRKSLRDSLGSINTEDITPSDPENQAIFRSRFSGERAFRLDYFNLICGNSSQLDKIDNRFYFKKILDHTQSSGDINLLPLIRKMAGQSHDMEIRQQSAGIMDKIGEIHSDRKRENERIVTAKQVLSETRMPQTTEILRLLRDKSHESKRLAIFMIGKFRLADMLPEVCECLNVPGLEPDATAILMAFGNRAEEELIRFYLVSSANINASKTIMRLLARLPLNEGTGFLFSRLWSNSRQLKEVALKCLIDCRFIPSVEEKERLNILISDVIGIITWNLSAKSCLEKNNDVILLKEMNKELNRWSSFLINILSLTYNAEAITRMRKNLEFETIESVHYAHAIIDIIVDDSVKAKIIYLLDVIPDDEKLKNLNQFFPVEIRDYGMLLEDILNRDYNLLSLWTKASVLRYLPGISNKEMAESVVALLFSPEGILQEEAVQLISRSDLMLYKSVYNRMPVATRKHLDKIISGETDKRGLLFDKTRFLSGCFAGMIEEEALALAREMIFATGINTFMTTIPEGYILWTLESGDNTPAARILYPGSDDRDTAKNSSGLNSSFYVLPLETIDEFLYQFPENENIILKFIEEAESLA